MGKLGNGKNAYAIGAAILIGGVTIPANLAQAGGFGDDTQSCAADRPCFNGVYEAENNKVVFQFTGVRDWELYNVSYIGAGGERKQIENRSGSFTLTGTQPNHVYNLSVQGCNKHTFSWSTCSPWVEASLTTKGGPTPPAASPPAGKYSRLQIKQGGKFLDAAYCSDRVALNSGSTYAAGACQLWRLVPAGDGWSRLQLKQGGKYLDAVNCSDQLGLNGGSTFAGGACQLWRLVPAGDGWGRLQVKQGGKYLDAAYCSEKVVLNNGSTYANGACQLWRFVD